ncbi:MAG: glycosyltransferase family 4 protein [Verrucomicrobia subdivision 3 bacterium]|nr:glycosyltransferase family 4 protein [Limisphaerales bacterium]
MVATGQYLSELAIRLAERGHTVTVIASRRAYDQPSTRFPRNETWRGIEIHRVWSTGFGKGAKWKRGLDFATFMLSCCWKMLRLPRFDVVVALTSPPLISFMAAFFAKWRRAKFLYWVMDLNPDEAIAAGWLREGLPSTRVLHALSVASLRRADKVIALDRFMRARIAAKGIAEPKIAVIPPWSHSDDVRFDELGRQNFRRAHGLEGKFVVMYSGNHSPCHPLDTLLQAATRLADRSDIVFCFVGGGSEFRKIQRTISDSPPQPFNPSTQHASTLQRFNALTIQRFNDSTVQPRPPHILCLPYQPLSELAGSLSAADLHVAVMGDSFVGTIHPCKIYNILTVGSPVLYIGPRPSHISELFDLFGDPSLCRWARHGDVDSVVQHITDLSQWPARLNGDCLVRAADFSKEKLLPRFIAELESLSGH